MKFLFLQFCDNSLSFKHILFFDENTGKLAFLKKLSPYQPGITHQITKGKRSIWINLIIKVLTQIHKSSKTKCYLTCNLNQKNFNF